MVNGRFKKYNIVDQICSELQISQFIPRVTFKTCLLSGKVNNLSTQQDQVWNCAHPSFQAPVSFQSILVFQNQSDYFKLWQKQEALASYPRKPTKKTTKKPPWVATKGCCLRDERGGCSCSSFIKTEWHSCSWERNKEQGTESFLYSSAPLSSSAQLATGQCHTANAAALGSLKLLLSA